MTWRQANLSLQLLAEERIGSPVRRAILEAKAREDAAAAASVGQVQRMTDGAGGNR